LGNFCQPKFTISKALQKISMPEFEKRSKKKVCLNFKSATKKEYAEISKAL
jgi:hypothetical protein